MRNIRLTELLGDEFKGFNYGVTSNWRIDFSNSKELIALMGDYGAGVPEQMSFACHSDVSFETQIEYAEASIKGMHISQAAWQDRYIDSMVLDIYEAMDHRLFKALVTAANHTAGYFDNRDIALKSEYTFSDITLTALGNSDNGGEPTSECVYSLLGVQINKITSPEYSSTDADIASVKLDIRAHGWAIIDGKT